jgi:hypothetical protein
MDGTIANLYGVDNWLDYLINSNTYPYEVAKPMVNMSYLARLLNRLINKGYLINIISWTSKNGTPEYNEAVKQAKIKWLKTHLKSVNFSNIYVIPYGTPKHTISSGILFDDEEPNRIKWGNGAYTEKEIFKVLKAIA